MKIFRKKTAHVVLATALALLWLSSMPATSAYLMDWHVARLRPLDGRTLSASPDTAIVILGLGEISEGREYGHIVLTGESYERLRYGISLAAMSKLPVLYTGGRTPAGEGAASMATRSEAAVAQQTASAEFRQPIRWVETRGITVRDSAKYTAGILQPQKISRIILVAHAWKMPRAIQEFEAAGFNVVPAPVAFPEQPALGVAAFFPTSEGVRWVRNVTRERFGMLRDSF